ncbi:HNH endonuclease [Demequina maris]|uniref:HNH endonuclease n=1 Tax=Demequina maris TaxID=1638982 RepID=UPI0007823184|nr:HNH endonuclease signature motif containing protein [Demequina maris]
MAEPTAADPLEGLRARVEAAGGLTDRELESLQGEVVGVRRETDILLALLTAHSDKRGLAKRRGHRSTAQALAHSLGGTLAEAERIRKLGETIDEGEDDAPDGPGGEESAGGGGAKEKARPRPKPPVLPYLARVARAGRLSPDAVSLLRDVLMLHPEARERAGMPVDDAARSTRLGSLPLGTVERTAVDKAVSLPLRRVRAFVANLRADLTPRKTAEERYDDQFRRRMAMTTEESDGMIRLTALLDPMTAAPLIAAMDGYVKKAFRARREGDGSDQRTPMQLRADALGWLGRHATGCRAAHDGIKTTISIRMTLEDLVGGDGHGTVDGVAAPVPAGVLRRHAADAQIIPTVLGGRSEILDHGRAERLFTPAQRRAIAERDRGCAHCGAPPSHCDVHHLRYWENGGRTDLANGIMLCVACHHWVHRDRWEVRIREGRPEFVPPAAVDPERRPRPGYRHQVTWAREEVSVGESPGPP